MAADVYSIATGYGVLNDSSLSGTIDSLISDTTAVAGMLFLVFIALKLGYEYFKSSVPSLNDSSQAGRIIDFDEVIRLFVLMVLLALYQPLSVSVTGAIRQVNDSLDKKSEVGKVYSEVMNEYYYQMQVLPLKQDLQELKVLRKKREEQGLAPNVAYLDKKIKQADEEIKLKEKGENNSMTGNNDEIDNQIEWGPFTPIETTIKGIITYFIHIFTGAIDWGISAFVRIVYKILLIIGPLAIATSVFWKDKFMAWFEALLNTGLAFVVLQIFSILKSEYIDKIFSQQTDMLAVIGFNIAIIACYFTVFRFTAMWIGKPLAGAMMSRVSGAIGSAAAVGIVAAGAAFTGGSSAAAAPSAGAASPASKQQMD